MLYLPWYLDIFFLTKSMPCLKARLLSLYHCWWVVSCCCLLIRYLIIRIETDEQIKLWKSFYNRSLANDCHDTGCEPQCSFYYWWNATKVYPEPCRRIFFFSGRAYHVCGYSVFSIFKKMERSGVAKKDMK